MTTKYKIISAFLLMIVLLVFIAFSGHSSLQRSSDGFAEYNRLSDFNVAMSDMGTAIAAAAYNIQRFTNSREVKFADQARKEIDNAIAQKKEADALVKLPERVAMLAAINKDLLTFRDVTTSVQNNILEAYKQYTDVVSPLGGVAIAQDLKELARLAHEANNTDALYGVAEVWDDLASARSSLSRFAESGSQKDSDRARTTIAGAQKAMADLGEVLHTTEGKRIHGNLTQNLSKLFDSFIAMDSLDKAATKNSNDMDTLLERLIANRDKLNSEVDSQMISTGKSILQSNATSQQEMMWTSIAGLLLGAGFAAFIIYGIIHMLNQIAGFASAVSKGNFAFKLNIKEKGEIGAMVGAMRQIPAVLEKVTLQANNLANNVVSGHFRDRLHSEEFSGSFSDLTKAVNTVSDAYRAVIDSLPVPIMACDKNNSILFLNSIAQSAIGGNYTNTGCSEHLKAAECDSDKCFGVCAMSTNAPYSGETTIHPQGKPMEIAVSALPLHDLAGTTVGYLEIITDLTEMKTKQATMLNVAHNASAIADRVASASEELAAQVEEISHGAEVQRSRMESTASAMTEMNATVLEVARNASQASEQTEDTRHKAEQGADLVNKVVASINTVNTVAATLQNNMQHLGKLAEGIGGVMNVISDIADQTNLLALNAAIEAARAGEAGRGFAVVADEVRKLAEKTMVATKEVGSNITSIQQSARSNIEEVGNAVTSITTATDLANSSGRALQEIVDLAAANSSVVASIATAAEEQSATSEEINRSIEEINHIVSETTDGMMQSASAVQDLSQTAQELRRVMDGLR